MHVPVLRRLISGYCRENGATCLLSERCDALRFAKACIIQKLYIYTICTCRIFVSAVYTSSGYGGQKTGRR